VSRHAVLIFSADPLAAALLGAVVELAGLAPHYVQEGEAARAALLRIRPPIILADCDHEESCAESFIGPAIMTGAQVALVCSHRTVRDIGDLATRMHLTVLDLSRDHQELDRFLHAALAR
jgi:hypothetical protein